MFNKNITSIIFACVLSLFMTFQNNANASSKDIVYKDKFKILELPNACISMDLKTGNISYISKNLLEKYEDTVETIETSVVSYEQNNYIIHTVSPSDNLWNLAKKYYGDGTKFPYIMEVNKLKSTVIIDGSQLIIPIEYIVSNMETFSYETQIEEENNSSDNLEYAGVFKITGYDPWCAHCCTTTNGITASGVEAVVGRTVACNSIPMGTQLYIEGYGYYTVEDTGGMKDNVIDIACNSHKECYAITNKSGVNVYIVE